MTLKEYLSGQHAPPEIQAKLEELYALPDRWLKFHINPGSEWHAQECCYDELAEELKAVINSPT